MRPVDLCRWAGIGVIVALAVVAGSAAEVFHVATFNLDNYLEGPTDTRPGKSASAKAKVRESLRAAHAEVVALQEIGGREVLLELQAALQADGLDYPHWDLVGGADTNIQVAVLSQFPIVARRPHTNESFLLFGRRFRVSRGFSEVDLEVNQRYRFTLLAAHLKSRRVTWEADESDLREQEALRLRAIIDQRLQAEPEVNLVVVGDFNDTKDTRPVRAIIGRGRTALVDTRPAERNGDDLASPKARGAPRRITWTHYYEKEDSYSRFDYILVSRGMAREWQEEETRLIVLPNWGIASDHRPIVAGFLAEEGK